MSGYESDRLLAEYLLFHYGTPSQVMPGTLGSREALRFPIRCVKAGLARGEKFCRALDVGCAVGRGSFELARHGQEVIGLDFSRRFIAAARELQRSGRIAYARTEQGDLATPLVARLPPSIDRQRVRFLVGDAHRISAKLGTFDVVLAANLIDRLREPMRFLRQLPRVVKPGGRLILTSPYTWSEEFTPRANWLGGMVRDGARILTFATLRRVLLPDFEIMSVKDLPFLIREHARKFQWSVAQASIWRRRETEN